MINEVVPIMIEKYLNENQEKLLLSIETMVNGRRIGSERIVEEIKNAIATQLNA